MIEHLPKIDPGWSPSVEHLNTIIRKLNDVIDAVNILNTGICQDCHGTGFYKTKQQNGTTVGVELTTVCHRCHGSGRTFES